MSDRRTSAGPAPLGNGMAMARKPAALWFVSVMALAAAALLLVRRDARSVTEEPQTEGVRYSAGL